MQSPAQLAGLFICLLRAGNIGFVSAAPMFFESCDEKLT
jgi:hypothetical protein